MTYAIFSLYVVGFVSINGSSSSLFPYIFFSLFISLVNKPHPAKYLNISCSISYLFSISLLVPLCLFNIDGWSINNVKSKVPFLTVLIYVYISSPLPIKEFAFQFTLIFSENFKLYGGNHIILPLFGPCCSSLKALFPTSFHAKFSMENI